jgi:hypothetical protein
MKKIYLLLITAFLLVNANAQVIFSEIHYDNGVPTLDANEGIEIFAPAGTDLTGWSIVLYNGAVPGAAVTYGTTVLSGIVPNLCTIGSTNYGVIVFTIPGIQNGPNDGMALVNGVTVVEFLSYEGGITASNGPAIGLTSTDIGASEDGLTGTITGSIQRLSTGNTWITNATANTFGGCNTGFNVLAFHFYENVNAYQLGATIKIEWSNLAETNMIDYQVERSFNGIDFTALATLKAAKNNGARVYYNIVDASALPGINFYRIRSLDINGKIIYSAIVKVNTKGGVSELVIYPNPVIGRQLTLQTTGLSKGNYTLKVFNTNGQQVFCQPFIQNGSSGSKVIQLPEATKAGVYNLMLSNGEGKQSKTFILQ